MGMFNLLKYVNPLKAISTPARAAVTTGLGGLGLAGGYFYGKPYTDRAWKILNEEATGQQNSYQMPTNLPYSVNKPEEGKTTVYTDTDTALSGLKMNKLQRWLSRGTIDTLTDNAPAYIPNFKSVFLNKKYLGTKVLAHELGHSFDKNLSIWDREPLNPKNIWYGWRDPDKSPLVSSEIRAWDIAGIPAGDKVREAALDTYRAANKFQSRGGVLLTPAVGAGGAALGIHGIVALYNKYRDLVDRKRALTALKDFRGWRDNQFLPWLKSLPPERLQGLTGANGVHVPYANIKPFYDIATKLDAASHSRAKISPARLSNILGKLSKLKLWI